MRGVDSKEQTYDDCVIFEFLMGCLHRRNCARERALASHDVGGVREKAVEVLEQIRET